MSARLVFLHRTGERAARQVDQAEQWRAGLPADAGRRGLRLGEQQRQGSRALGDFVRIPRPQSQALGKGGETTSHAELAHGWQKSPGAGGRIAKLTKHRKEAFRCRGKFAAASGLFTLRLPSVLHLKNADTNAGDLPTGGRPCRGEQARLEHSGGTRGGQGDERTEELHQSAGRGSAGRRPGIGLRVGQRRRGTGRGSEDRHHRHRQYRFRAGTTLGRRRA
ncbi:hypothetical protein D9M71_527120 [compost metagenome]